MGNVVLEKVGVEPFYQEPGGIIYCGDCLEILPQIPDKSVDLILTDPPYGIRLPKKSNNYGHSIHKSRKSNTDNWDDSIPTKKVFDEIFRISKNQIVFGANYFWKNFYATTCYIIWDKRGNLPEVPFCPTEFAWTSFSQMPKKYTIINHGFISDSNDLRLHPTQKPTELIKRILVDFSQEGDLICDPFLGSGTTAVAAKNLNRKFIGIEINPSYCAISKERLRQEVLCLK